MDSCYSSPSSTAAASAVLSFFLGAFLFFFFFKSGRSASIFVSCLKIALSPAFGFASATTFASITTCWPSLFKATIVGAVAAESSRSIFV